DVMKTITAAQRLRPGSARSLEQSVRAHDVGAQKALGILDGAIHVRFGGKVYNGVDALLLDERSDPLLIADVAMHEAQALRLEKLFDAREITRVGQSVEHYQAVGGMGGTPVVTEVGANKSRTARDKESLHRGAPVSDSSVNV